MDNTSRLIWEAYSSYRLPNTGEKTFGDFYLTELLLHKINTDPNTRSSRIADDIRELYENMIFQLGTRMLHYLKAAILDEFLHITDMSRSFRHIYDYYKSGDCSNIDDATELKKCIYAQIEKIREEEPGHQNRDDMDRYYQYIRTSIDNVYESYGNNIVYIICKFASKYKGLEYDPSESFDALRIFIGYFEDGENDTINKAWSELPQGMIEMVMYDRDDVIRWDEEFECGGELWGVAATECRELELILENYKIDKLPAKIDRIYDLQHNNGTILDKSSGRGTSSVHISHKTLGARASARDIEDLASKVSKSKAVANLLSRNGIEPHYNE